jgi:hypothetical protein
MKPAIDKEGQSPHPDEGSAIRARSPSARPSSPDLTVPRETRIEQKVIEAEALLASTVPSDPRRRLLQAAMLRRDEALLDAILTTLHSAAPVSGPGPSRR